MKWNISRRGSNEFSWNGTKTSGVEKILSPSVRSPPTFPKKIEHTFVSVANEMSLASLTIIVSTAKRFSLASLIVSFANS